jgi:hypothetical protein
VRQSRSCPAAAVFHPSWPPLGPPIQPEPLSFTSYLFLLSASLSLSLSCLSRRRIEGGTEARERDAEEAADTSRSAPAWPPACGPGLTDTGAGGGSSVWPPTRAEGHRHGQQHGQMRSSAQGCRWRSRREWVESSVWLTWHHLCENHPDVVATYTKTTLKSTKGDKWTVLIVCGCSILGFMVMG